MGIRINLLCNKAYQKEAHEKWEQNYNEVNFPNAPKRDKFGILIKQEEGENANIQE